MNAGSNEPRIGTDGQKSCKVRWQGNQQSQIEWVYLVENNGESGGARTRDHRIKSAMLYQLSYRLKQLIVV